MSKSIRIQYILDNQIPFFLQGWIRNPDSFCQIISIWSLSLILFLCEYCLRHEKFHYFFKQLKGYVEKYSVQFLGNLFANRISNVKENISTYNFRYAIVSEHILKDMSTFFETRRLRKLREICIRYFHDLNVCIANFTYTLWISYLVPDQFWYCYVNQFTL